mgnify:CR=1 FL=1
MQEAMNDEPVKSWVVVMAVCVVGFAVVVILVIAVVSDERVMRDFRTQSGGASAVNVEEHRRQVFIERQQNYEGKTLPRTAARD